tara:strand:- start:4221 stop:5447 length:1227 start_codon:yes stop_codon:yes gene_type:complete
MAIDFGRAARGIATGYLTAKVADTARQDEINGEFIQAAASNYFNEDRPNFLKQEELRYNNFLRIKRDKGLAFAQLADSEAGGFATTSEVGTNNFLRTVAELKPDQIQAIETNYNERKSKRVQTFNEKNAYLKNYFKGLPGGLADNTLEIQLPDEGKDVSITGIKQDMPMEATTAEPATGLMDIASGKFDITNSRHATELGKADNDFRNFFVNDMRQPSISFAENQPQYELQQFLLQGYDDAVKNDYKLGKYEYARNKFINMQLEKLGITDYPTGFDMPATTATVDTSKASVEAGAVPGDGVKFDAETFGQRKEDAPQINLMSQRQMIEPTEDQRVDNPASIINEARESIASIMEYDDVKADIVLQRAGLNQFMTSTLDEKKQALIANARQLAKDEIKNIGLNPDNFEL